MLSDLDRQLSLLAESVARRLNRRRFFVSAAKGVVATVAALTLGQVTGIKRAFANLGCCDGTDCGTTYGFACPNTIYPGCPSECTICTSADRCLRGCPHPSGYWTCNGLGTCQNGWTYCTDCKCPRCDQTCTCASLCHCCNCCTPQDVAAEMKRLAPVRP